MEQKNIFGVLKKLIGSLLVVVILITVLYGTQKFIVGKRIVDGNKENDSLGSLEVNDTKIFDISELCKEKEQCSQSFEVKVSDKVYNLSFERGSLEPRNDKMFIDSKEVELPEGSEILEMGILKSKYFVVSYKNDKKNFYYLDTNLREVKRVSNVEDGVSINSAEYGYYGCQESDIARGGVIKNYYKMKITDNGTFMSTISSSEEGSCS